MPNGINWLDLHEASLSSIAEIRDETENLKDVAIYIVC